MADRPTVGTAGGMGMSAYRGDWIRLQTLVTLRWFATGGQLSTMLVAEIWLDLDLPRGPCLVLVTMAVLTNIAAMLVFPAGQRLSERSMTAMLLFDVMELLGLIALTGGLNNPFALMVLAPCTIAATTLPARQALLVCGIAILGVTVTAFFHIPLHLRDGRVEELTDLLEFGFWVAIVTGIVFVAGYARRVSNEVRVMGEALLATQLALAREQKLTDLGGVVAAAAHELGTPLATIKLTSAEMIHELGDLDREDLVEDAQLIREQADRCRDILRSMGRAGKRDSYITRAPLMTVIEEAAEPHVDRGKLVTIVPGYGLDGAQQPSVERRPEVIHGLRNLIQNAVDFAETEVVVEVERTAAGIHLRIMDDGPGFPEGSLGRLGDPFLRIREAPSREPRPEYEGMGLGLFIAKTLLERTGAEIEFMNRGGGYSGALVSITWPVGSGLAAEPLAGPGPVENPHIVD